jgi:hypothetical protein
MAILTDEAKANIKLVRDTIEALDPSRFNMALWNTSDFYNKGFGDLVHQCGTCGCIGGWTEAVLVPDKTFQNDAVTATMLGLSSYEAWKLFYPRGLPDWSGGHWSNILPKHAVQVLDHLLETGEVDWSIITE